MSTELVPIRGDINSYSPALTPAELRADDLNMVQQRLADQCYYSYGKFAVALLNLNVQVHQDRKEEIGIDPISVGKNTPIPRSTDFYDLFPSTDERKLPQLMVSKKLPDNY